MIAEVAKRQLLLVYDGDCPMCMASVALLKRRGLVTAEQAVSNHDLSPEDLEAAQTAGIRNQLVVLDPQSRATRSGVDGLLWIVGENYDNPWWVRVAALPLVRPLVRFAYDAISYNRRILSPPRHAIRCDCEPQATLGRRLTLVGPLVLLTATIAAVFGAAVFHGLGMPAVEGVLVALVAWGIAGLALTIVATVALRSEQRIDYLAHQSVIAFVGALLLVPAAAFTGWLPPTASALVATASFAASIGLMFRMQDRRLNAVGLPIRWHWIWSTSVLFALLTCYGGAQVLL